MNLRTLKKLSKKAVPLLAHFHHEWEVFPARKQENYTGIIITARKHWERGRSVHPDCIGERMMKRPAADGRGWVYMRPPSHPRKGTPMAGAMVGYYEPEWDERTALELLMDCVSWNDRPATMSDEDWSLALRITGCQPVDINELIDFDRADGGPE